MVATVNIIELTDVKLDEANALLAESFVQDPTIQWMLQKDSNNFKERVKTYMGVAHQFYVDVRMPVIGALVNDELKGVLYGGYFDNINLDEMGFCFKDQIEKYFEGTFLKRVLDYEQSMSDELLPNSYLLGLIAVSPDSRGQGIGSQLINYVIQKCKKDNQIKNIMLDTANIRNIDLYERLGFKSIAVKAFDDNFLQTVMVHSLE